MTAPIPPADSATASARALIVQLCGEINANRKGALVPAGSLGDLDLARATETIVRCAGNADLLPTLAFAEAEDLARAFVDGDDGPFVRYSDGHSLPPTEESDLGVDEVLVLCALLAAREQWAWEARIVGLPASRSAEPDAICPACGSMARLEILLGQFSERYAVCPACDALWRIPRIGCPHCGEGDGRHLVVYNTEGRTDRALVHCLICRRVWRRLDLKDRTVPPDDLFIRAFEPWSEELLFGQRDDVLPVPLRPLRGTLGNPRRIVSA
ncbi:MAG: formate dehydrogenase accessory protein FdhE [Isosphaeraceae bacterium]